MEKSVLALKNPKKKWYNQSFTNYTTSYGLLLLFIVGMYYVASCYGVVLANWCNVNSTCYFYSVPSESGEVATLGVLNMPIHRR